MYLADCGIHLRSKGCLVYLQLTEDTEETLVLRAYIMLSLGDSDELKVKKKTQLLSFIIEKECSVIMSNDRRKKSKNWLLPLFQRKDFGLCVFCSIIP